MMDIYPIKTESDYDTALAEIDALWEAKKDTPEGDRLEILATLVEAYEARKYPIDPPDPIDAILFRMEQTGMTRDDLTRLLGSSGKVSDILNRKRPLSMRMIKALHTELHISLESLVMAG